MERRKFLITLPVLGVAAMTPFPLRAGEPPFRNMTGDTGSAVKLLLSRLDLDTPELETVRAVKDRPAEAASALLAYYRARHSVVLRVDRAAKASMRGKGTSAQDLQEADDAVKHIFVGQPTYPAHFCGKDIDWSTNPYTDKEWLWQLNRMTFWNAMARAYWSTGDEKYARAWAAQLVDWIRKNPHDAAHGYAWRSIEAGIRGRSFTELYQYFVDSPAFTPAVLVAFLNSCYDHASYLMTVYHKKSNWALMEAEGLAHIGYAFPEFSAAAGWRGEATRRLVAESQEQVYPDGFQRELSISYHVGCIFWFWRTYQLARDNGHADSFPASYPKVIEKMCEVPMKMCFPDGTNAQFGDAWEGKPGQYRDDFARWASMFDRDDFRYMATGGESGTAPRDTAYNMEDSGFHSFRSGWDSRAVCLILKCGPDGGGHCQPDNGTFALYAGGRHLMPDSGSYIYSGDPEGRAWFRQTRVHQTLTLDGKNARYAPRTVLWQPGDDADILVVENDSYPALMHRRAVVFIDRKFFVIVDEALGEATGQTDIHFQFAPGEVTIDKLTRAVTSGFTEGWNVSVQPMDVPGMILETEEGQVSFIYHKKQSRPAVRYRQDKISAGPLRFVTAVVPFEGTIAPRTALRWMGPAAPGSLAGSFQVEVPDWGINRRVNYHWS